MEMEEKILARFEHMRKYFGVTKAVDDVIVKSFPFPLYHSV